MPEWTPSQQNAIDARNSNILVSAAAGSGKTAVLTERVVNMITDEANPVDLDSLLIVTFTNAAAAEMRMRISKALNARVIKEPNNTNILRQISLLPSAKICTIDSFCINLVRENFFKLDISQDFKILDNAQQLLLEDNAANELIEKHYETENDEFKKVVELLCSMKNDSDLVETIKRIASYVSVQPFVNKWLDMCCEEYNPAVPLEEGGSVKYVVSEVGSCLDEAFGLIDKAKELLDEGDELYTKYFEMLESDRLAFESIKSNLTLDWDSLMNAALNVSFMRMPSKRGYTSPAKGVITSIRDSYKDILKSDIKPLFIAYSDDIKSDNEYLYPIIKTLCSLVAEFNENLLEKKRELNAYSFADIERFAMELLFYLDDNCTVCRTDLASELSESFYEILVDEYQDTNAAQDTLFEMLSNGRNRFMVGDVKQSIYRFRLAMPDIFNAKKEQFEYYSADSDSADKKIILDKNFRSRKGICDFTNFIFSNLMSRKIGELDYTPEDYLNNGAVFENSDIPSAQINILEAPEEMDADEYEARQAAQLILHKIRSGETVRDGDSYRKIKFSDFAVLFRSPKRVMPVFAKVFGEYGIPTVSNNRINLFDNNEVSILMSLLRTVDNPSRDVELLATLMSVFYGYSADDIARARVNSKGGNLYSAISKDESFKRFLADIELYRQYASSMSVESFLRQIISDTSYLSVISAMGDGEQRRQNVMKLLSLASNFDKGENVGLTAFIRFVDNIIERGVEVDSAELSGSGAMGVSLMSVHQSKGLEFPVCIFAGTAHKYNTEDLRQLVLINNHSGIGLKVNNENGLYRYNSLQYSCIKNINACASQSENLRVLYVAITRAKEQFIIFSTFKNKESVINRLSSKLLGGKVLPSTVKHIQNDAEMLLLCALMHKDAKELRTFSGETLPLDTRFDFKLDINFGEVLEEGNSLSEDVIPPNDQLVAEIEDKLSFSYFRRELSGFSSKRNASELDERDSGFKFFAKTKPAFLDKTGMSSAQRGSAMHAFMQYADFSSACADITAEARRLNDCSFITAEQLEALNTDKLKAFFNSDIARRIMNSDNVYREFKVSAFVPVSEFENTEFDDEILVQGIADCVFEEDGELVLVDYKTDYVKSEDELLSLYKKQLAFYRYAIEKTLNKPVKESLLYSFKLSKECLYK